MQKSIFCKWNVEFHKYMFCCHSLYSTKMANSKYPFFFIIKSPLWPHPCLYSHKTHPYPIAGWSGCHALNMFDLNKSGRHVTVVETEISHILGQKNPQHTTEWTARQREAWGGFVACKTVIVPWQKSTRFVCFFRKEICGLCCFIWKNKKMCHLIRKRQISE